MVNDTFIDVPEYIYQYISTIFDPAINQMEGLNLSKIEYTLLETSYLQNPYNWVKYHQTGTMQS